MAKTESQVLTATITSNEGMWEADVVGMTIANLSFNGLDLVSAETVAGKPDMIFKPNNAQDAADFFQEMFDVMMDSTVDLREENKKLRSDLEKKEKELKQVKKEHRNKE